MPFRPYHETLDRPSVLPVERYENKWLSRLKKFEENPTFPVAPRLYPIPMLEYEGRRLCGICWEPGHPTEHAVFTFYKACRHVCCYECLLRWLFVSCEKRCPICVANEVSHKLAVKLAWAGLPNVANTPHFSFGSEAGDFLPKEVAGNNRIFFTRSVMDSVEAVARYVATLNSQVHTSSFYQLGSVSLWCETSDKMVGDMVVEALTLYCPVCFRDFTATRFGVREKNRIDLFHVNGHLKRHKNALCEPCFHGQALFPRDEFVFETEELAEYHKERTHLQCKLCTNPPFFYDKPELVHHCRREHFMCYVCDSSELFFLDASSLYKHIVSRHYACTVCPRNLETVTAFTTVTKLLEHHFDQHANEPIDVERFELLYAVNKNIVFYEDNPFRHKLDLIDGSMRRLYRAGRFHFEVPELQY